MRNVKTGDGMHCNYVVNTVNSVVTVPFVTVPKGTVTFLFIPSAGIRGEVCV